MTVNDKHNVAGITVLVPLCIEITTTLSNQLFLIKIINPIQQSRQQRKASIIHKLIHKIPIHDTVLFVSFICYTESFNKDNPSLFLFNYHQLLNDN